MQQQVREMNQRFYDAIEALDVDAMDGIWDTGSGASCVHPGGPWLRGWAEVRDAWEAIMANTGYIEFDVEVIDVRIVDPVAWVVCVERIRASGQGGGGVAEAAATNIFVLGNDGWRLSIHHASPIVRHALLEDDD